jgi:N utilization substance protein A
MVVNELNGEKIDIIPYSEDLEDFVMKALAPAKVNEVRIDYDTGTAEVIVPDFQLSLAIGKEGQNARLAHRLVGLRVDIRGENQVDEAPGGGWAEGEWITDAETGEQMWQPADGGPAISAAEWNQQTGEPAAEGDEPAGGEASADATTGDAAAEEAAPEPSGSDRAESSSSDDVVGDEPAAEDAAAQPTPEGGATAESADA